MVGLLSAQLFAAARINGHHFGFNGTELSYLNSFRTSRCCSVLFVPMKFENRRCTRHRHYFDITEQLRYFSQPKLEFDLDWQRHLASLAALPVKIRYYYECCHILSHLCEKRPRCNLVKLNFLQIIYHLRSEYLCFVQNVNLH